MLKKAIAGWNAAPGAPRNWNPARDGECGALPIRVFPPAAATNRRVPVQWCESAWEPTPAELELLNQGGQVVLLVAGWQPPVALSVEPLLPDDETITPIAADAIPRCGDHVQHIRTGEIWLVAFADEQVLAPTGWPDSRAPTASFRILRRATEEEHREAVAAWFALGVPDSRRSHVLRLYSQAVLGTNG